MIVSLPARPEARVASPRRLHVVHCGKVTDVTFFGGCPYFMWQNLAELGLSVLPHDLLRTEDFPVRRLAWRLRELAAGRGLRGYMFSNDFLETTWARSAPVAPGDWLINFFQLYPESILDRAERGELTLFYYIDLTLDELFHEWAPASDPAFVALSDAHIADAMARERRGYRAARRIITFSRRSARMLVEKYGIDRRKVTTVTPGANIDEGELADVSIVREEGPRDFRIGYVGTDHRRKGLPKLAAAVLAARRQGAPVTLRVIGPRPSELENTAGIELIGPVNKFTEMRHFIELIASCDLGCLLSAAEGLPISLLEFLRLGVPVVATDVNGTPDIVKPELGILVKPTAAAEEIATLLARLASRQDEYRRLLEGARRACERASWRRAARELRTTLLS